MPEAYAGLGLTVCSTWRDDDNFNDSDCALAPFKRRKFYVFHLHHPSYSYFLAQDSKFL